MSFVTHLPVINVIHTYQSPLHTSVRTLSSLHSSAYILHTPEDTKANQDYAPTIHLSSSHTMNQPYINKDIIPQHFITKPYCLTQRKQNVEHQVRRVYPNCFFLPQCDQQPSLPNVFDILFRYQQEHESE